MPIRRGSRSFALSIVRFASLPVRCLFGPSRSITFFATRDLLLAAEFLGGAFIVSLVVGVGMWLERYVIIVTSLHRDFLPSSWGMYEGTWWDVSAFVGTIGLFVTLIFLFVRFLPAISIFEMRTLLPEAEGEPPGEMAAGKSGEKTA